MLNDVEFERAIATYAPHVRERMRIVRAEQNRAKVSPLAIVPGPGALVATTRRKPRCEWSDDEHIMQTALFEWADEVRDPSNPLYDIRDLVGIPNVGTFSIKIGRRMKQEGRRKGFPDTILPVARGIYHGAALELKREGAEPQDEQRKWIERLIERGWRAGWADSLDDAMDFYTAYLLRGE